MGARNDFINSNDLGDKKGEIEKLLRDRQISVLCINDTRLTARKKIRFKGYKILRKDNLARKHNAGGVAILIGKKVEISLRLFDIFQRSMVFIFL